MRAREPDEVGYVERDGVRVAWRAYGGSPAPGVPTVLLLPAWCIVTADVWKLQIPFLARRTRVVTFDPRGNGASDRPSSSRAHRRAELTRDALDVLDASDTHRALVVGFSSGNAQALDLASAHPDRVAAWVAIAPSIADLGPFPEDRAAAFDLWGRDTGGTSGWARYNRYSWVRDYRGFTEFFFGESVPEGHSTKLVEDLLGWSATTDGETLVRSHAGDVPGEYPVEEQCAAVRCPVVVVHGSADHIIPHEHGVRLAELTGGSLLTLEGSGHVPHGRDPVVVNRLLDRVLAESASERPVSRAG